MPVSNESSHLKFESVHEILKYDHSKETTCIVWAVLSCGTFYYVVQRGFKFDSVHEILKCDHS